MQQGRFRHDDMIHHPGAQPYGYVPTLVTRGVDQFCLAGMVWFWKALKITVRFAQANQPSMPCWHARRVHGSRAT
jgi:hypothetical protein